MKANRVRAIPAVLFFRMAAIMCGVACVAPVSAQAIYGTAHLAGGATATSQVLSGTSVILIDSAGSVVAAATTDARGAYLLHAPGPGSYRARARLIGFAPDSSKLIVLSGSATAMYNPAMRQLVTLLAEVNVDAARRCVIAPASGAAAFRLWQEVQNALAGTLSGTSTTHSFILMRFERTLDPRTGRVLTNRTWQAPVRSTESYKSIPAESLATSGFVTRGGGGVVYAGPDARVLISDAFARTHCLRPVAGASGSDSVGLAFQPVRLGARTDVSGTLWLTRSTGKLKYMEFQYVDSAARARDSLQAIHPPVRLGYGPSLEVIPPAKGRVDYRELANGGWIIDNWKIQAPVLNYMPRYNGRLSGGAGSAGIDSIAYVVALWEIGGRVTTEPGVVKQGEVSSAAPASLHGSVIDSVTQLGVPDVEAIVRTPDLQRVVGRATTDSVGHFAFDSLASDIYVVEFRSGRLDTLGVVIPQAAFSALPGDDVTITTAVPSSVITRACADSTGTAPTDRRIVHGVVRDVSTKLAIRAASVRASWLADAQSQQYATSAVAREASELPVTTDSTGSYVICGLPTERALTLTISATGRRAADLPLAPGGPTILLRNVDLARDPTPPDSTHGAISGTVRDPGGAGIPQAQISLLDNPAVRALTDSAGAFRIVGIAPGEHAIRFRKLGLAPVTMSASVTPHNVASANVVMAPMTVTLATVQVRVQGGELVQLPPDVAKRIHSGQGHYMTAGNPVLARAVTTANALSHMPGLVIANGRAFSTRGRTALTGSGCSGGMPLYVNSVLMTDNSLDMVAPSEIAAIEFYPSVAALPAAFSRSPCGAILIWTR